MKDITQYIKLRQMSDDDAMTAANEFMRRSKMLRLWEDGETHMIWCDQCQRSEPISLYLLRRVKLSRVCPMCFRETEGTTSRNVIAHRYVEQSGDDGEAYGYDVRFSWENGKVKTLSHEQCAYWYGKHEYVKGIIMTMSGYVGEWTDHDYWREAAKYYGYFKYRGGFYSFEDLTPDSDHQIWDMFVHDKRSYYECIAGDMNLKSNQVKLISEGLYSKAQIEYIKAFDLKQEKEVLKYSAYIRKYWINGASGWNVSTLDYLWRNNIRLSDYLDYAEDCRLIGRKVDKPKDFQYWHRQIADARDIKKNEKLSDQITERSMNLQTYHLNEVTISPIKDYTELTKVGITLHNCIRTYAERYAEGKCDLYVVYDAGAIKAAIEVRQRKVIQARGDKNAEMPRDIQRVVDRWELTLKGATDGQKVPRARSVQV